MSVRGIGAIYNGGLVSGAGRKRRTTRRRYVHHDHDDMQHGRGFFSGLVNGLKTAKSFVKDNKLISNALDLGEELGLNQKIRDSGGFGATLLKSGEYLRDKHGYGRRRVRRVGAGRRRVRRV